MTESFRNAPRSKYPEGSEPFVFELVEFAERYGALHPETFAGAECRYVDERPRCVASFTGDLPAHRAALDPRIHVEGAAHTKATWDRLRRETTEWILSRDDVELIDFVDNDRDERLAVLIEAERFDEIGRELTARFGELLQVERISWVAEPRTFETWEVDGRTLTVHWTGGADERPLRLDVEEVDDAVSVRAISERQTGPGQIGDTMIGVAAVGIAMSLSTELQRPLGERRVIDGVAGAAREEREPYDPADEDPDEDDWMLDEPDHPTRDLDAAEMQASWRTAEAVRDAALPYLQAHRSDVAAEWFEEFPWGVRFCVAFGPGARHHRPHLDPSINVRRSEHSRSSLERMQREVADLVARTPGCSWSTCEVRYWDPCEREVLVTATAEDAEALAELIEEHVGDEVSLHVYSAPTHDPTPTPFVEFLAEDDRQLVAVRRDVDGGPAFLLLHETDETVLVTVVESRPLDDPGQRILLEDWDDFDDGPQALPPSPWVGAELVRPLGDRAVVDATTGEPRPRAAHEPD